jgi:hypothetical protein
METIGSSGFDARITPKFRAGMPFKRFVFPGYQAILYKNIDSIPPIKYDFLLMVYDIVKSPNDPVLCISSESSPFLANGTATALGLFHNGGHRVLYEEGFGWSDESKFIPKALSIANGLLKIQLADAPKGLSLDPDAPRSEPEVRVTKRLVELGYAKSSSYDSSVGKWFIDWTESGKEFRDSFRNFFGVPRVSAREVDQRDALMLIGFCLFHRDY